MFIGLVVAFVVVGGVVVHSSLAKEKDVEQEEQLPVFGGRRGQASAEGMEPGTCAGNERVVAGGSTNCSWKMACFSST